MLGQFGRLGKLGGLFSKSDVVRAIFRDATPGFSVIVEQAVRANEAALGVELSPTENTAIGWVGSNATVASSGGLLAVTATVAYTPRATSSFTVTGPNPVVVKATVASKTVPNNPQILVGDAPGGGQRYQFGLNVGAPHSAVLWLPAGTYYLSVGYGETAIGQNSVWDNISVREIDLSKCQAFQDAGGMVPVTAMEQPLGLLLDAGRGLVRGVDLTPQGVNLNGNTDHGDGSYTLISGNSQVRLLYNLAELVNGSWYEVDIRFEAVSGPANIAADWCDLAPPGWLPTAGVTYKLKFPPRVGGYDSTYRFLDVFVSGASATARFRVVGLRELPGNHLSQPSNTASRPIVRRRVNLLTSSVDSFAGTDKANTSVTAGHLAPDGTLTAAKLLTDTATAVHALHFNNTVTAGRRYLTVIYAKAVGENSFAIANDSTGSRVFNLDSGTLGSSDLVGSQASIVSAGDGWFRCSLDWTASGSASHALALRLRLNGPFTGDGESGILLWHPDLRLTSDTLNLPAYQRVTSSTDYEETGFPAYAEFDGVDDWLEHGEIDFTGTDEMTLCAGLVKLAESASWSVAYELSTSTDAGSGQVALSFFNNSSGTWFFRSRGTSNGDAPAFNYAAPHKAVLTGRGKIGADSSEIWVNGTRAWLNTVDQGTGNYGKHRGFIGRRGAGSLPAKMRFYGLTVVGKTLPDAQRNALERTHNKVVKAYQ